MKLDLRKAYDDTLSWEFLEQMLLGIGCPQKFVDLEMICVTTPKFSLLLNDSIIGFFSSKGGLRQGDPMSPLLFALSMDYLERVLCYIGELEGFKFHARCKELRLMHLCFADDLLLFCMGILDQSTSCFRGSKCS